LAYKREYVKERFRPKPGKLLDQVREVMRYHHYAIRTEQTYVKWMLDYIRFNGTRHPREMGKPEIERFLSHLAVNRNVAPSTQNQALNAILFLYKHVLDMPLNDYIDATRSKKLYKSNKKYLLACELLFSGERPKNKNKLAPFGRA
jgi:site-specific recombinase XerD